MRRRSPLFWLITTCLLLLAGIVTFASFTWSIRVPLTFRHVRVAQWDEVDWDLGADYEVHELLVHNRGSVPVHLLASYLCPPGGTPHAVTTSFGTVDPDLEYLPFPGASSGTDRFDVRCPAGGEARILAFISKSRRAKAGEPTQVEVAYNFRTGTRQLVAGWNAWLRDHLPSALSNHLSSVGCDEDVALLQLPPPITDNR